MKNYKHNSGQNYVYYQFPKKEKCNIIMASTPLPPLGNDVISGHPLTHLITCNLRSHIWDLSIQDVIGNVMDFVKFPSLMAVYNLKDLVDLKRILLKI